MTIRDQVFTVLKNKPGTPHSIKGVADQLPDCNYEQVANSLADLALFDERIERTARGVYVYYNSTNKKTSLTAVPPSTIDDAIEKASMPKLEKLIEQVSPFEEERADEHLYFTQVGVAENGDIIISRDSDTKVYRATPV